MQAKPGRGERELPPRLFLFCTFTGVSMIRGIYGFAAASLLGFCAAVFSIAPHVAHAAIPAPVNSEMDSVFLRKGNLYSLKPGAFQLPPGVTLTPKNPPVGEGARVLDLNAQRIKVKLAASLKSSTVPNPWDVRATAKIPLVDMKTAAKNLFKFGAVPMLLTVGLSALMDGIDWLVEEGKVVRKIPGVEGPGPAPGKPPEWQITSWYKGPQNNASAPSCSVSAGQAPSGLSDCFKQHFSGLPYSPAPVFPPYTVTISQTSISGAGTPSNPFFQKVSGKVYKNGSVISGSYVAQRHYIINVNPEQTVPRNHEEIDHHVDANYTPHPSDLDILRDWVYPSELSDLDFDPVPTQKSIKTVTNPATGDVTATEVEKATAVEPVPIAEPLPLPSPIPLKLTETVTEKVSLNGQPPVENVMTKDVLPQYVTPYVPVADPVQKTELTEGSAQIGEFSLPTDCSFFPTICRFIEWFQADVPDDGQDLAAVLAPQELSFDLEDDLIPSSGKTCPSPTVVNLHFLPGSDKTISISYDLVCGYAQSISPFLIAFAYLMATFFVVRNI